MAAARPFTPPSGRPTTMTVLQDGNHRNYPHSSRYSSTTNKNSRWKPQKKEQVETAMELIPADDDESVTSNSRCSSASSSRPTSAGSSRPNSSNSRRAPPIQRPDSASGRRTPSTPTKQVTLQAVPRKPDRSEEKVEKINWAKHRSLEEQRLRSSLSHETNCDQLCSGVDHLLLENSNRSNETEKLEVEDLENSDSSENEDDSSTEQDEEEEIKAPNELLMEFITCLQQGDFENGKKLCKMILMYEPDNPEAIKFQSLIDEKIDLEAEMADQSSESDSEEGSSDEETDDEGSGESGEESSSTESSSDEEEDDESEGANKDSIKAALEIP